MKKMRRRMVERLVEVAVVAATICASLALVRYLLNVQTDFPCKDYVPAELVLNCLDRRQVGAMHEEFSLSPDGSELVGPGNWNSVLWITNWAERAQATRVVQEIDFGDDVQAVAHSGDGSRVAISVDGDPRRRGPGGIALYDPRTRQLLTKWLPTAGAMPVEKLVLSHDGTLVLTGRIDGVWVWRSSTGELVGSLKAPESLSVLDFAYSQGRVVVAYQERPSLKVIIYRSDSPYGRLDPVSSIANPGGDTSSEGAVLSADGTRLALNTSSGGTQSPRIKVYQVSDGHLVVELEKAAPHHFAFSANRALLAASHGDDSVTVWNVDTGKELCSLRGFGYPARRLAFGPGNKTLVTRDSCALVVWDISAFTSEGH